MALLTHRLRAAGYRAWELYTTWLQDPVVGSDSNERPQYQMEPAGCEDGGDYATCVGGDAARGAVGIWCDEPVGFSYHDCGPVDVLGNEGSPSEIILHRTCKVPFSRPCYAICLG